MKPELSVLPPMNEVACATAGCASTTSFTSSWRSRMAGKEMSCGASEIPAMLPVSCCGKRPFGMMT